MSDAPAALLARDVVRSFGAGRVVDGFSLTAPPGRRIGLIGENGVGKSTLLRLLAGADEPDAGSITRPADLGFLHQEMPFAAAATLTDVLDEALSEVRGALAEIERLSARLARAEEDSPGYAALLDAYGRRLERAQEQEAWDADRRATMVLEGLGLGGVRRDRTLGSLSGGQRGRLALASLLIRRPSALLLDEPTNHLDDGASAFLEEQVCGLPGAVVVASHDRAFLDAVCTDLIDLDPAVDGPVRYGGNYSAYQAEKRAERERWERRYAEEQEELDVLRRSIGTTTHRLAPDRGPRDNEKMGYGVRANRVQSQISRRARNAARRLDELERHRVAEPPQPLRFRRTALAGRPAEGAPSAEEVPSAEGAPSAEEVLVSLREVRVPGRLALDHLDVSATERLLVTGENGAGKSTLLAVLAGRLTADGDVRHRGGLSVGLLAQDTVFRRPDRTVRDLYAQALGPERAEAVPLSSLGLMGEADLGKQVGHLSVGQRRRLALALLVAHPPELLLLDEPTNHLSPRLCDELEAAMGAGPGAIVLAGHDRWLRRRWQGRELRL
ncbi:macrolide transport system ATP-binding/permease protein [Streptomyces sp. LamerLS-316]|uniref:ABC-F family ATP-binding cassette domain-containing protein n=1 Tax=unclassified Streptomyces TaxID=2593676 RepID=UPI000823936D|nr:MULTISPECIES: ABC-F family ATP-binding cassette domain-containing protein [unclassified Streptomyces]MYQ41125.1 ATP-binding cassette domain-containing protein [Streptomyces sp. SID4921]SCK08028.1 macrolide transport system ATP-binding/permease protein [Streptomyces sp. LamerLS-316]